MLIFSLSTSAKEDCNHRLFVSLSVGNFAQKLPIPNGFARNFQGRLANADGPMVVIRFMDSDRDAVRRALAVVCPVPVLLVLNAFFFYFTTRKLIYVKICCTTCCYTYLYFNFSLRKAVVSC